VKLPALQGKAAALLLEMTLQQVVVFLLVVRLMVVPLLLVGHLQMVPLQVFALQVVSLKTEPLPVVPLLKGLHLPETLRLNRDYRVVPRTELSLA
jgi:hypothetical protein